MRLEKPVPEHPSPALRGQEGFAVPTVLFIVLASFAIAGVAIVGSIHAQTGTSRDLDTKDALAVAEAGAHQAWLRYNAAAADGTCVSPQTLAGGWCSPATGTLASGGQFTYQVAPNPPSDPNAIWIVSQGVKDGVTRRIKVKATSGPTHPFLDAGVIGFTGIELDANTQVTADVATNGEIGLDTESWICGDAQVPEGIQDPAEINGHQLCGGQVVYGNVDLPPVNQGDVPTNNSNGNFFANTPVQGQKHRVCFNGFNATGAADNSCGSRELELSSNVSVTLPSGNYSLCRLALTSNANILIPAGASVRLYFDSPEACGYTTATDQLEIDSNSNIEGTGNNASLDIVLLFVGSDQPLSNIHLASNTEVKGVCQQDLIIYAPSTSIEIASNAHYCGAIAAEHIHVNSLSQITTTNQADGFLLPNARRHYGEFSEFVECRGPIGSPPDGEC
jgi:hypothetical protein